MKHDDPIIALYNQYMLRRTVPAVGCIPTGTIVCYDEFSKVNEQENEMELVNTKVFEYCIINFDEDGAPFVAIGPCVVASIGEENPRDSALLKIGSAHADVIDADSEVQIRPFC